MDALPPGIDLSQVPLAANPNGDPPNFVNPPSLISTVQAVGITLGLISLVLVILRLTVYHRTKRGVGFDDVFVVMAFLLAAGYTGISCSLKDVTRHAWDTPISFLDVAYLKKLFVTSLFYGPMLFFAKASILLLYYRAFRPIKWLRISIYVILFILFCSYIVTVPLCFNYCMPHNGKAWDLTVLSNCNHLSTPGLVQAGINIAADITIFILPLPIIYKLQMPTGKKFALACVFATGLFALVASILTVSYRISIVRGGDASWAGAQTYICIQAEVYVSISVACMPSLAKIWNVRLTETRIYKNMQSLLSFTKSKPSYNNTGEFTIISESTIQLQTSAQKGDPNDLEAQAGPRGIYIATSLELTSMERPHNPSFPH